MVFDFLLAFFWKTRWPGFPSTINKYPTMATFTTVTMTFTETAMPSSAVLQSSTTASSSPTEAAPTPLISPASGRPPLPLEYPSPLTPGTIATTTIFSLLLIVLLSSCLLSWIYKSVNSPCHHRPNLRRPNHSLFQRSWLSKYASSAILSTASSQLTGEMFELSENTVIPPPPPLSLDVLASRRSVLVYENNDPEIRNRLSQHQFHPWDL